MQSKIAHDAPSNTRRLAVLVREAIARESYQTIADLAEDVKARAARLRIPYEATSISDAILLVGSNTPLVPPLPRTVIEPPLQSAPPICSRRQAAALLQAIRAAVIRTFPAGRTPEEHRRELMRQVKEQQQADYLRERQR